MKIFAFLIILLQSFSARAQSEAIQGHLDLRGASFDQPVALSGEWSFYWQKLWGANDAIDREAQALLMRVPGVWTGNSHKLPSFGFGTYRLTITLDQPRALALYFPAAIWTSSRIFVDGEMIAQYGEPAESQDHTKPGIGSKLLSFTPKNARFEIRVEVANFEIFLAGMNGIPTLGTLDGILQERYEKTAVNVFIIGALFIMGIYHCCLFSLRRSDPSTLFFGLLCLGVASYLGVTRDGLLYTLFPDLSFSQRLRLYSMTWMSCVPLFLWFAYYCFRQHFRIEVPVLLSGVAIIYTLLAVFTQPRFFVSKAIYYQALTLIASVYTLGAISRAGLKKIEGAYFFLTGVAILLTATVLDILSIQGYLNLPAMGGFGLFSFTFFQSYMIAHKFSLAFKRLKISEKEIRKLSDDLKQEHENVLNLNTNLERMVDEKTRDIRSIMEHIPLGIFMIKADFHIHKDHSRHLHDLLHMNSENIETSNAIDVIFQHSNLSSDARSQAISTLEASLGGDALNFDVNSHTLPLEINQTVGSRSRVFDVTWNAIENGDGDVDKILVTLRDVTELRKLQLKSRDQQEELEFIGEILNIHSERFLRFIQSCQTLIQENDRLIHSQSIKAQNLEVLKVLFINMHTIKGAARSLYFKKMTQVFHDVEQYYATLQKDPGVIWDLQRMESDLKEAANIVSFYEKIAREKLGRMTTASRQVEFPIELVAGLYDDISTSTREKSLPRPVRDTLDRMRATLHVKLFRDATQVFDDIIACLPVLARDLQKETPRFILNSNGILLSERAEELFRRVFVHLLRNSMDHGLENASERIEKSKEPHGVIMVDMWREDDRLCLHYKDDGRGLHLSRIRELGVARHLIESDVTYPPNVLAELIFDSGLSTANRLSDISGRGVGMDAVRSFLKEAGGDIHVHLLNVGQLGYCSFYFQIELPFQFFEESLTRASQRVA